MRRAHRLQFPRYNELMSFCGSDPLMNLYLEESHSVASKPYLTLAACSASPPAWREDHLLYPLPERGQLVQPPRAQPGV